MKRPYRYGLMCGKGTEQTLAQKWARVGKRLQAPYDKNVGGWKRGDLFRGFRRLGELVTLSFQQGTIVLKRLFE